MIDVTFCNSVFFMQKELVKDVQHLINETGNYLNESISDITVEIILDNSTGYEACVESVDANEGMWPRDFEIRVSRSLLEQEHSVILTAIAHEMVHVYQHAEGRLYQENGSFIWNDKLDNNLECIPYEGVKFSRSEYFAFPWEREAYGLERALYEHFRELQDKEEFFNKIFSELCLN